MKATFEWGDNTISSEDIIARHEELQDEYDTLVEALEEASISVDKMRENCETFNKENTEIFERLQDELVEAQEALDQFNQSFEKDELDTLTDVISVGEDSPDWSYGETLILDSYFTDYITDLINDCYEIPKEIESGSWPWRHMSMDYEAAAEEAKSDYFEIEAEGFTYHIRA